MITFKELMEATLISVEMDINYRCCDMCLWIMGIFTLIANRDCVEKFFMSNLFLICFSGHKNVNLYMQKEASKMTVKSAYLSTRKKICSICRSATQPLWHFSGLKYFQSYYFILNLHFSPRHFWHINFSSFSTPSVS